MCARHGAKRHELVLPRPAVVAARGDLAVKVRYRPGKGND
jgi:hypothetical protein